MAQQLKIWSTVLLCVAVAQAGLGSGLGASLIARDKSELLEKLHSFNAIVVIVVAAVCVVLAAVHRRRGGARWPLVFAVSLISTATTLAVPYLTKDLIDRALFGRDLA